jgi:thioester reductase-like protein
MNDFKGATGFLGIFLLEKLLQREWRSKQISVVCLARAQDDATALQRLIDTANVIRLH